MSDNLLAVSGGPDSMYLACHYDGIIAHFNHKMRTDSDMDADFVKQWCIDNSRQYIIGEATEILHSEEDARIARYEFLQNAAKVYNCSRILTAHNMNDNAETVILNLVRGTGIKGLCGIPPVRDNIYRPMLNISREEIEKYLSDNNIPYVIDSTNMTDKYNRNIIRHKIIPELLKINPNLIQSIYNTSNILKQDEDFLSKVDYCDHPAIVSRYIINNCPQSLSYKNINSILNLGPGYKQIDLPGIHVVKDQGNIFFNPTNPQYDVSIEELIVNNKLTKDLIDCDSIVGKLSLSNRQPGDKIRPVGRKCTKTLKSLFMEMKLTQEERNAWPVIRDDIGLVWVYKVGIDERVSTKIGNKAFQIRVKEN